MKACRITWRLLKYTFQLEIMKRAAFFGKQNNLNSTKVSNIIVIAIDTHIWE